MTKRTPAFSQVIENYGKLAAAFRPSLLKVSIVILLAAAVSAWCFIAPRLTDGYRAGLEKGALDQQLQSPEIRESIASGVREKIIYIDGYHGAEPANLSLFKELGLQACVSYNDLSANKNKLFRSGLLLMNYAMGRKEFSGEEMRIVRQYIVNGGRVILFCPAWVWVAYEKKPLDRLPYQFIAQSYGLLLTADYVAPPLRAVDPVFPLGRSEWSGTFSNIIYTGQARPILAGSDGRTAAVAAEKGGSKIIVWAQNNLLNSDFSSRPAGKLFLERIFGWLFK